MRVVENPHILDKSSGGSRPGGVFRSLLPTGKSGKGKSQDDIVSSLEKLLDNKYVLLKQVTLEGLKMPIPFVLVGPPGVRVLYPFVTRGIYRAQGESWEKMDDRQQKFKASTPNLVNRARLLSRAVGKFIASRGYDLAEAEAVLIFPNPGTHVDSIRPSVRIVLADGLERFTTGLVLSPVVLDREDIQKIVNLFVSSMGIEEEQPKLERDAFSFADESPPRGPTLEDRLPRGERAVSLLNKIPLTSRQWLLISLLVIVNIIILVALILFVLISG